jgi:MerR family transcriptional regulator, redox-sensitive transcriptional activator SoxR
VEKGTLSIGEVATRAGVRPSSIRYYESLGVLAEPDRVAGQRRYDPEVLQALTVIRVAQGAGFSLEEIGELLAESGNGRPSERLRSLALRKVPEVEALIAKAEAMKGWLEAASDCDCSSLDICALFENG